MNKKKIIPVIVVVLALIVSILYFEVIRHVIGDNNKIEGSGTIEVTEIDISSKIAGRVVNITREEGEAVNKGELLVKLEYDELDAQRVSVAAHLANTKKNLGRISSLYKSGSVSKKDYDNIVTAYRVAKANFDMVNASIENAVIISPLSGIVLEKNLEVGEMAFPGTPVVTIADLKKVWIRIYVNETDLGRVHLGQKADIYVDSFPDKAFKGKVIAISNRAEFTPKTIQTKDERVKLMYGVKISVSNPKMDLKPGMPADAYIFTGEEK